MRRFYLAITCITMGAICFSSDFATAQTQQQRSRARKKAIERFDADQDGRLNADELAAARRAMGQRSGRGDGPKFNGRKFNGPTGDGLKRIFDQLDTDGDGKLDQRERAAAQRKFQTRPGPRDSKSGKGQATNPRRSKGAGDDMAARRKALRERFDRDGDGQLSAAEQAMARQAAQQLGNRAGGRRPGLTGGEPQRARLDRQKLLQAFDADGNGELSGNEKRQAIEAMRKKKQD